MSNRGLTSWKVACPHCVQITLPKGLDYGAEAKKMAKEMLDISRGRIESFA